MKKSSKLLSSILSILTVISTSSATFAASQNSKPSTFKKVLKYGLIGAGITTAATITAVGAYKFFNEKVVEINSEEDFEQIRNCRNTITKAVINVETVPNSAFEDCKKLKEVELNAVKNIEHSAFVRCTSLKTIKNSSGVKAIGEYAFSGCSSLKEAELPGVEYAQEGAFNGCESLKEIDLSSIKNLGKYSFSGCNQLQKVTLPKTASDIKDSILIQAFKKESDIKFNYK